MKKRAFEMSEAEAVGKPKAWFRYASLLNLNVVFSDLQSKVLRTKT